MGPAGAGSRAAGRGGRPAAGGGGAARAGRFRRAAAGPAAGARQDRGERVSPDQVLAIIVDRHRRLDRHPDAAGARWAKRSRGGSAAPALRAATGMPSWPTSAPGWRSWRSGWISPSGCCCRSGRRASLGKGADHDAAPGGAAADARASVRSQPVLMNADSRPIMMVARGAGRGDDRALAAGAGAGRRLEGRPAVDAALRASSSSCISAWPRWTRCRCGSRELEERLDFAERLLARSDGAPARCRAGGLMMLGPRDADAAPARAGRAHDAGRYAGRCRGGHHHARRARDRRSRIVWPLIRALARRLEGGPRRPSCRPRSRPSAAGCDQLEQGQVGVAELEERLDFAERMLAQSREPDRLQR